MAHNTAARNVHPGATIDGHLVIKTSNAWGVVNIWFSGSDLDDRADRTFNHGDPVTVD